MGRRIIGIIGVLLVVWGLGCAGVTEQVVELGGGGEVEIADNGDMVWHLEDGKIMRTRSGTDVAVPEAMPMPRPWPDAPAQSVITLEGPDGTHSGFIVTYEMKRTRQEITAVYEAWFAERGLEPTVKEESKLGTWTLEMQATEADGTQATVTMNDFFGFASVSLVYGKDLGQLARR